MKGIIWKTVLITLVCLLGVIILVFGILTLVAPKTLVDFNSALGNESLAIWYSERAYEKSQSSDDLYDLLCRANENKDYNRSVKYTPIFMETEKFKSLTNEKNYFVGKYVVASYNLQTNSNLIFDFIDSYNGNTYLSMNPYEYLIFSFNTNESSYDSTFLTALKQRLLQVKTTVSVNEQALIDSDITIIDKLLVA